jgi:hypothetical protein
MGKVVHNELPPGSGYNKSTSTRVHLPASEVEILTAENFDLASIVPSETPGVAAKVYETEFNNDDESHTQIVPGPLSGGGASNKDQLAHVATPALSPNPGRQEHTHYQARARRLYTDITADNVTTQRPSKFDEKA